MARPLLKGLPPDTGERPGAGTVFALRQDLVGPDTPFASPKVRRLHDWWETARNGRPPRRRDFDVTEHPDLVPNLFLVERLPDGDFLFRVQGGEVIHLLGINTTGRTVGQDERRDYAQALAAYYRAIVADGRCRFCTGRLAPFGREHIHFEAIDCPLLSDDGSVTAILGVLDRIQPPPAAAP